MAHGGQWNPPNFGRVSGGYSSSITQRGVLAKSDAFNKVIRVCNQETSFSGTDAGTAGMLIASHSINPQTMAGSASFANGGGVNLGELSADTMYNFNLSSVSASNGTLVYVFKK